MKYLKKEELNSLQDKEFSILLFYADGCVACQTAKPVFQQASEQFSKVGFYAIEIKEGLEYYNKFAEQEQEVMYEAKSGYSDKNNIETVAVPLFNEDGTPKMKIKYTIPSFFVHHTKAISEENPTGFVGGWEGASRQELEQVIELIHGAMYDNIQAEAQIS